MKLLKIVLDPYVTAFRHRELIWRMARREIESRTKATILGTAWLVISPLLLLGVYTFVFTVIFTSRWNIGDGAHVSVALLMFSGLTAFGFVAECVSRAPGLVLENTSYVKKVVFPLEVLPWISLIGSLVTVVINMALMVIAHIIINGLPPVTVILTPIVLAPLALMTLGVSWFLASLGVFLRDVRQLTSFIVSFLMFLGPVFYPLTAVPEHLRHLMYFNPLTPAIEQLRQVMFLGEWPDMKIYTITLVAGLIVSALGYVWFMKTRKGFADVL